MPIVVRSDPSVRRWTPKPTFTVTGLLAVTLVGLAAPACGQSGFHDWSRVPLLHASYPGVQHVRVDVTAPRLMKINAMRIDLLTPNLRLCTTGRVENWEDGVRETLTKTTRQFIDESRSTVRAVIAGINAQPWDVVDNSRSVPVNLVYGLAVSEGVRVSSFEKHTTPAFTVNQDNSASIIVGNAENGLDTSRVTTAVSGFLQVLRDGTVSGGTTTLNPRTGIGLSQDGRHAYFVTVDGRATMWSQGATEREVGEWLKHFGAHTGINMDGGGSTTMAWWNPSGSGSSRLLNVPRDSNTVLPDPTPQERHVGNSIGVCYAAGSDSAGDTPPRLDPADRRRPRESRDAIVP